MKYTYHQFQELLPELDWSVEELADRLSTIGHETEIADGTHLNVTTTSNRSDCKDLRYLVFDLAGVYNLKTIEHLIELKPGLKIEVRLDFINKLLGATISDQQYQELRRLGFEVNSDTVIAPAFRQDIQTPADIAEEIVRLVGYSSLQLTALSKQASVASPLYEQILAIKTALVTAGLTETITSSFSAEGPIQLKNPFANDQPYLRASLLEGLLRTLARNPYLKRAAFFEIGTVFTPEEKTYLGIIIAGYKNIQPVTDAISQAIGDEIKLEIVDEKTCLKLDVKQSRVQWRQIPVDNLRSKLTDNPALSLQPLPQFQPISKYPPLVRDATIVVKKLDDSMRIIQNFHTHFPELLLAEVVDSYHDEKITVTFRLIFQKMGGSFTQKEISVIDQRLAKAVSVIEEKVV